MRSNVRRTTSIAAAVVGFGALVLSATSIGAQGAKPSDSKDLNSSSMRLDTSGSKVTSKPGKPGSVSCGSQTYTKASGGTWKCTFADEFSGGALDTRKWSAQETAVSGLHSGPECLVNDPDNVAVGDGVLRLTARKEAAPFTCASPRGSYTTEYTSGGVTTYGKFSQAFGRFEFRARFPGATVPGLQSALWLYPEQQKYGTWPKSGEIDVAEAYSLYPDRSIPVIHYVKSDTSTTPTTNWYCKLDPSQFNTYVAEWTRTTITITNNGTTCLDHTIAPAAPLVAPAPFDQPFNVILTQVLGVNTNAFDPVNTPLPATMEIDWVRVWA
jgi:beta-glucanase (GH16 family)